MQAIKENELSKTTIVDVLHTASVNQGTIYIVNLINEVNGEMTAKVAYIFKNQTGKKFWISKKEFKEMLKGAIEDKNLNPNLPKNDIDWVK